MLFASLATGIPEILRSVTFFTTFSLGDDRELRANRESRKQSLKEREHSMIDGSSGYTMTYFISTKLFWGFCEMTCHLTSTLIRKVFNVLVELLETGSH